MARRRKAAPDAAPNRASLGGDKQKPQMANKVVKGGAYDLGSIVKYLSFINADRLEGLYQATRAKMKELGLKGDAPIPAVTREDNEAAPTGNVRGILNWIDSVNAESDEQVKKDLHSVHTLLSKRRTHVGIS